MDIKDLIIIAVGGLTILRFALDMFGTSKNVNAEQDTKIALLEQKFDFIKDELKEVNTKLDNHIEHISLDIGYIKENLIRLNK